MSKSLVAALALLIMTSLLSCGSPILLLPGGALAGELVPVPADWGFVDEIKTVQLETNPKDPYSVNIWIIGIDDALYAHAGANRTTWVENIESDPAVRVRIGDKIYPLSATRVADQAEFDRFANAYEAKYGLRPRHEKIDEVYLYRLAAR